MILGNSGKEIAANSGFWVALWELSHGYRRAATPGLLFRIEPCRDNGDSWQYLEIYRS